MLGHRLSGKFFVKIWQAVCIFNNGTKQCNNINFMKFDITINEVGTFRAFVKIFRFFVP